MSEKAISEIDGWRAEITRLRAEVAQQKNDLKYQTDARVRDAKDNQENFRRWKAEHHTPAIDCLRAEVEALRKDKEMLDWLDNSLNVNKLDTVIEVDENGDVVYNVRKAIRAAMEGK